MPIVFKSKLDVICDRCPCKAAQPDTLVVLLPGAYDTPDDFVTHGFVRAVRARHMAVDLVMVDAHVGYYTAKQIVDRLQQDIVAPAREQGYLHVWLVGISLGGYGTLLYSRKYGEQISGMFLIAPFLGNRSLIAEIGKTGLAAWQAGKIAAHDCDRELWVWLQDYVKVRTHRVPLHLGYGLQDRFTMSNRLLAAVLPSGCVETVEGGHTWQPWRRLWEAFLGRGLLPYCAGV